MFYLCMGISMLLCYVLSVYLIIWHVSYPKPYDLLGFTKRNVCIYVSICIWGTASFLWLGGGGDDKSQTTFKLQR